MFVLKNSSALDLAIKLIGTLALAYQIPTIVQKVKKFNEETKGDNENYQMLLFLTQDVLRQQDVLQQKRLDLKDITERKLELQDKLTEQLKKQSIVATTNDVTQVFGSPSKEHDINPRPLIG